MGAADELQLLLSIGGLAGEVLFEAPPETLVRELKARFDPFTLPLATPVERAFSVTVRCEPAVRSPDPSGDVTVTAQPDSLEVWRGDFAASLHRIAGGPLVGRGRVRSTPFAFESLLRVLWSALLPAVGGGLVHACGLHHEGRALLCPGESGAGKTTLARKAAEEDVLSDEIVALSRGPGGEWRLGATPFFGELQRGARSPRSHPLAGIAFLEKRAQIATHALPLAAAVQKFLGCLICFEAPPAMVERGLALGVELCREIPAFVCASRADTPIEAFFQAVEPRLAARPAVH